MAHSRASRHFGCADPAHFGHRAKRFRTVVRRCRKTVRISLGSLSELDRISVRNGLDGCPNSIGSLSELRRNTHLSGAAFGRFARSPSVHPAAASHACTRPSARCSSVSSRSRASSCGRPARPSFSASRATKSAAPSFQPRRKAAHACAGSPSRRRCSTCRANSRRPAASSLARPCSPSSRSTRNQPGRRPTAK